MFHDDKTDLVYSGVVNLGSEIFAALLQTSTMELFEIIVGNITLKPLAFLTKRSLLHMWLGPGCAFGYDTVLKIPAEISPWQ